MGTQQQFCLKWNNHHSNMLAVFESLLSSELLVDVTLACEGQTMKAHKIVLSACSPFFQSLFAENPCQHPIVILKDMHYSELRAIISFMYKGEVNVSQEHLATLLKTAETLKIKGLAEVSNQDRLIAESHSQAETPQNPGQGQQASPELPHHSRRKRGRPRKRSLSGSNRSDEEPLTNRLKETSSEIEDTMDDFDHHGPPTNAYGYSGPDSADPVGLSSIPQNSTEPHSGEEDFEPTRLMEQTLTTDNIPVYSNNTGSKSLRCSTTKPHSLPPGTSCLATETVQNDSQGQSPQDVDEDVKPRGLQLYDELSRGEQSQAGAPAGFRDATLPAIPGTSAGFPENQPPQEPQGFHHRPRYPNSYMLTLPPEVKASLRACFTNQPDTAQQAGSKDTFCHMCGRNFSTKGSLRRHQLLHKPLRGKFHCPCCPKAFSWPGDLQTHIRCFHPDVPKAQRKYKLHFRFKHPTTHQIAAPQLTPQ